MTGETRIDESSNQNLFDAKVYAKRRTKLRDSLSSGIALFLGNQEAPMNYPGNTYRFRQDSSFLYLFGLNEPGLAALIDIDQGTDCLFGDDAGIDDIIWMGHQISIQDKAHAVGIAHAHPVARLRETIEAARQAGRQIHFLPPYRADKTLRLETLLGIPAAQIPTHASEALIKAIVSLRSVKEPRELEEIEKALQITHHMHTTAMKMARPGITEQEIAGIIEGISISRGGTISFPVILTTDGQTLHNHHHGNTLTEGKLLLCDAGAATAMGYAGDMTRTVPVGGRFSERQKAIYEIVLQANVTAISMIKPGIPYRDVHLAAATIIARGLKELGLMKGSIDQAVAAGAHALFFPHGLGHMMGLDVHDMEDLGENNVGYDTEITRATQFGLAFLRLGRRLQEGFVITVEPGIYFIPALIEKWQKENRFPEFIDYAAIAGYRDIGGIRIEDDVLVTSNGCRILGDPLPKTVAEIEAFMT